MSKEEESSDLEKLLAAEERTRQDYLNRFGPPIVLPELDETDPRIIAFRQKMADLFGPMDPDPPTSEETMRAYFSRPEDPEVVRQRKERGDYWRKLYQEGLKKGYYNT